MDTNSLPTTCCLQHYNDNSFLQAYSRSASAIYTKLTKADFSDVPIFMTYLEHEQNTQDGYRVLYSMLTTCHPHLTKKFDHSLPLLEQDGNLFHFIRAYKNWIQIERINKRYYSEVDKLRHVILNMENDGRFENALVQLRIKMNAYDNNLEINTNTKFPPELNLEPLPITISNMYKKEERDVLFTENNESKATINRFNRNNNSGQQNLGNYFYNKSNNNRFNNNKQNNNRQNYNTNVNYNRNVQNPYNTMTNNNIITTRKLLFKTCPCCKTFGHDINQNGCDFVAQLLCALEYINNLTQADKQRVLQLYNTHQSQ